MLRTTTPKPINNNQLRFDIICKAAKEKNIIAIQNLLDKGGCIDERDSTGINTPASKLALEDDKEAVDFLRREFKPAINYIARSYATIGDTVEVEKYIAMGASLNEVVRGYAAAKLILEVKDCIKRGASINDAAYGFAFGKHHKEVEECYNQGASPNSILRAYALTGQHEYVKKYLARGGDISIAAIAYATIGDIVHVEECLEKRATIDDAMLGYGIGCITDQVEAGLAKGGSADKASMGYGIGGHCNETIDCVEQKGGSIDSAAGGFAISGLDTQVDTCIKNGAMQQQIAFYYAKSGHKEASKKFRTISELSLKESARGSAMAGDLSEMKMCSELKLPESELAYAVAAGGQKTLIRKYSAHITELAKGMIDSNDFANPTVALHSLTFIGSPKFRGELVREIGEIKEPTLMYDISLLLPQANKFNLFMDRHNLNYTQSLAWTNSDVRLWFLLYGPLFLRQNKLAVSQFLAISSYFAPMLTHEAEGLSRVASNLKAKK